MQDIAPFLEEQSVSWQRLTRKELREVQRKWLAAFATRVKALTGKWVYGAFMWQGFDSGMQPAIHGHEALEAYKAQAVGPFYIFNEGVCDGFRCEAGQWPDLMPLSDDWYVADVPMTWTMAFPHEKDYIGFFSRRQPQEEQVEPPSPRRGRTPRRGWPGWRPG